jgi:hypothetical protein
MTTVLMATSENRYYTRIMDFTKKPNGLGD